MKAEVFYTEEAERLYNAFQRAMAGARIDAVSQGVHNGRPAVTVEWEEETTTKRRDCCECLEALEMTFDGLMAAPEPDPTVPDPVTSMLEQTIEPVKSFLEQWFGWFVRWWR